MHGRSLAHHRNLPTAKESATNSHSGDHCMNDPRVVGCGSYQEVGKLGNKAILYCSFSIALLLDGKKKVRRLSIGERGHEQHTHSEKIVLYHARCRRYP